MHKSINCIVTGVGGQGTILASKLIAQTAIRLGKPARTAETIGMAQRGGSVVSHVRIGAAFSPLIPLSGADLILGFEPGETVRVLPYLKDGGLVIAANTVIQPVMASLTGQAYSGEAMLDYLREHVGRLAVVDTEQICADCGSARVINTALLGYAAASGVLGFGLAELEEEVRQSVKSRYVEMNITAMRAGADFAG